MNIKVLVYDNELGYYQMLRESIKDGVDFILHSIKSNLKEYDAIVFFLSSAIEAIDLAKLHRDDMPFVLAANNGHNFVQYRDNTCIVNLAQTRDEIIYEFKILFSELLKLRKTEKAL
jgi:hypothetical protein